MWTFVRTTLLAAVLLAGTSVVSAQVSVGINIGPPPPPRVVRVVPANPGPGFVWLDGYWYPVDGHYRWHQGYWTRPPYEGARWVGPRHDGRQFYAGYWEGDRGRVEHDHHWDRDRNRDFDRRHDDNDNRDHDSR
jgi:WXXGXW repeat (2 copies)